MSDRYSILTELFIKQGYPRQISCLGIALLIIHAEVELVDFIRARFAMLRDLDKCPLIP